MRYNLTVTEKMDSEPRIVLVSALPVSYENMNAITKNARRMGFRDFVDDDKRGIYKLSDQGTMRIAYIDNHFSTELGRLAGVVSVHTDAGKDPIVKVNQLVMELGTTLLSYSDAMMKKYKSFEMKQFPRVISGGLGFPEAESAEEMVIA